MAWNIGASDVANAMGTSVGSGALSLRQAVLLAAFFEFLGASLCGNEVIYTLHQNIIDLSAFQSQAALIAIGMNASLLAAGIWLQTASYFGWPVSTTHTIVGAMAGFGFLLQGTKIIQWKTLLAISSTWILSPLVGAFLSFLLFYFLRTYVLSAEHPLKQAKKWIPRLFALFVLCIYLIFSLRYPISLASMIGGSGGAACLAYIGCLFFLKRQSHFSSHEKDHNKELCEQINLHLENALASLQLAKEIAPSRQWIHALHPKIEALERIRKELKKEKPLEEHALVEKAFSYMQIASASLMAFSHGANDVANAAGPLLISLRVMEGHTNRSLSVKWVLIWCATGIVFGLALWGWRVIHTVGKKITELTPSRGFSAEFGCALTVMLASQLRMPISTTHTLIGSLLGIGLARGSGNLNLKTLKGIFLSWSITVPAGTILCWIIFYAIKPFFLG
ncbi:inorganic phosphate transporter [Candidatus Similichlamydia laticola]|nr:inorganic phosphate transporter [Candidatus Similichlamydia laticola]